MIDGPIVFNEGDGRFVGCDVFTADGEAVVERLHSARAMAHLLAF